jgi:hypothetical protein
MVAEPTIPQKISGEKRFFEPDLASLLTYNL